MYVSVFHSLVRTISLVVDELVMSVNAFRGRFCLELKVCELAPIFSKPTNQCYSVQVVAYVKTEAINEIQQDTTAVVLVQFLSITGTFR